MSFAVVSGASPQSTHGLSPHAALYSVVGSSKTPSSVPRATVAGLPPPFSLSATNGNDLVDMLGSAPNAGAPHAKRIGTDPAKFKTTICRNWEQTGVCSFRGCTFAHGVDDLRPPMRQGGPTGLMSGDRGGSPNLGPKISPNTSPSIHASAVHNGGHASVTKLDNLIEQLVFEVSKDKDMSLVRQEASRTLEAMIRREQNLRQSSAQQLDQQAKRLQMLLKKLQEKDRALAEAVNQAKEKDVVPAVYAQALMLLDETQSIVKSAETCLSDFGIHTSGDVSISQDESASGVEETEDKTPTQTRGYITASQKVAPIGLRPIGGSPSDSPLDSPRD